MAIGPCGDRGHLGDEPLGLEQTVGGILHIFGVRIDRGQRGHGAHQHGHRVGIVAKAFHELYGGFVQHAVMSDLVRPLFQFRRIGQLSEEQQISYFKERAVLSQHFNGIAAKLQNAALAIDKCDAALAGCRVHEARIVHHEPEVILAGLHLSENRRHRRFRFRWEACKCDWCDCP